MRLTFLGTGGVWAVPVHGCACTACEAARREPSRARAPASALLEAGGLRLLIDAGRTDLVERFPPGTLNGVLLTHFHADHVLGLTLMRWSKAEPLAVWHPHDDAGFDDLLRNPGRLRFTACTPLQTFRIGPLEVTPVPLLHSRPTVGWCVAFDGKRLAYLTDTRGLPDETFAAVGLGTDLVVLDCTYPGGVAGPRNHNDIDEARDILTRLAPKAMRLTHINHELDEQRFVDNFGIAHDGEIVDLSASTCEHMTCPRETPPV